MNLNKILGDIDIYLLDQLLKGRFAGCRNILDAGCGRGRNLIYFLQQPLNVYGIDSNAESIQQVRSLAAQLAPGLPEENFRVASIEELPFNEHRFDLVICSAVLHFARSREHFETMLHSLWGALEKGGYFFARLASTIGLEGRVISLGEGRYTLPDGTERYLVTEADLLQYTARLNGRLFEPLKTTNVQNRRCMTTWCLQKT